MPHVERYSQRPPDEEGMPQATVHRAGGLATHTLVKGNLEGVLMVPSSDESGTPSFALVPKQGGDYTAVEVLDPNAGHDAPIMTGGVWGHA